MNRLGVAFGIGAAIGTVLGAAVSIVVLIWDVYVRMEEEED
jgi:hypothetical protein